MSHGGWFGMGMAFGWMWIFWILPIAAIVFVLVAVARRSRPSSPVAESAEEILKRRYAHGEIEHTEFQKRLQDLRR